MDNIASKNLLTTRRQIWAFSNHTPGNCLYCELVNIKSWKCMIIWTWVLLSKKELPLGHTFDRVFFFYTMCDTINGAVVEVYREKKNMWMMSFSNQNVMGSYCLNFTVFVLVFSILREVIIIVLSGTWQWSQWSLPPWINHDCNDIFQGLLYMFGGLRASTIITDELWVFNIAERTWTAKLPNNQ